MNILEQITQMKEQGIKDREIVSSLQEQGISPREISDALSRSQIKNAVSGISEEGEMPMNDQYTPQPNYSQEEYSSPEDMGGYVSSAGSNTDTLIEIAEQVFSEKIKTIKKQIEEIAEFKAISEIKIENISQRLKRIEDNIDRIQISVLDRVGSYGKELDQTKKEVTMIQDSFGKMVNSIADKKEHKISGNKKQISRKR